MILGGAFRRFRERGPRFGTVVRSLVILTFAFVTFFTWRVGFVPTLALVYALLLLTMAAVMAGFSRRFAVPAAIAATALAVVFSFYALVGLAVSTRPLVLRDVAQPEEIVGLMSAIFIAGLSLALWSMVCQIVRGWPLGWDTPLWVGSDGVPARRLTLVEGHSERGAR